MLLTCVLFFSRESIMKFLTINWRIEKATSLTCECVLHLVTNFKRRPSYKIDMATKMATEMATQIEFTFEIFPYKS